MRLRELTGYDVLRGLDKKRRIKTRQQNLVSKLRELGFSELNRGAFGTVLRHPKYPYVLKIFRKDPCYVHFVNVARQHPDNPYFPRFQGKPLSIPIDKELFAIRMEPLQPFFDDDEDDKTVLATMNQIIKHSIRDAEIELLRKMDSNLVQACELVREVREENSGCKVDLHDGNLMMRGKQYVITDPLATRNLI